MFFKCDVHDWYKRFAGGTSALDFHHWVAWDVDHRPYGVSPQAYFADRDVAAPSDPTEPYPVVRTRNTIDPAWMPGDRVAFFEKGKPVFGLIHDETV